MTGVECIALFSTELRVLSTEHWGKSHKIFTADFRRLAQTRDKQSAGHKEQSVKIYYPQTHAYIRRIRSFYRRDAEGAENFIFCLSGDNDKQKHTSSKD